MSSVSEKSISKIFETLERVAEATTPINSARIASAIVLKRKIISIGFNCLKSHPFQKKYGKNSDSIFLHAEISALKNALNHYTSDELTKAEIFVCRVKRPDPTSTSFVWGMTKPCSGCLNAISDFSIRKVHYTTDVHGHYETM